MNSDNEQLAAINRKVISEGTLPAVRLTDGTVVQTGTVAAMLRNVQLYNEGARGDIEHELELSVPTLVKVGLFDLFSPEDWINGGNPGRAFVGIKAKAFLAGKK